MIDKSMYWKQMNLEKYVAINIDYIENDIVNLFEPCELCHGLTDLCWL